MPDRIVIAKVNYLTSLKNYLRLDPRIRSDLIQELLAHLEDKSRELRESGLSEEEATETAARTLGSPQLIAQQIYEVYSQGSWQQALFAALPHFLIALLFALHCWQNAICLLAILLAVIGAVIYGWCHSKPAWLFPWLGYYLIPVVVAGILLIYLPGGWAWFAALTYVPLALFTLVTVAKQTIQQDWLFATLMLLPIPIALGWMLALGIEAKFISYEHLYEAAPWIALSFVALAVTVAIFIRIKQRWGKVRALLTPEILILIVIALCSKSGNLWSWLLLILVSLLLLLGPALLENNLRKS